MNMKLKRVGLPPSKRSFNVISLTHLTFMGLDRTLFQPSKPLLHTHSPASKHFGPAIVFLHQIDQNLSIDLHFASFLFHS